MQKEIQYQCSHSKPFPGFRACYFTLIEWRTVNALLFFSSSGDRFLGAWSWGQTEPGTCCHRRRPSTRSRYNTHTYLDIWHRLIQCCGSILFWSGSGSGSGSGSADPFREIVDPDPTRRKLSFFIFFNQKYNTLNYDFVCVIYELLSMYN